MTVDGTKAIAYMRSLGTLQHHGACLYYVWRAYDAAGADTHRTARTALQAWELSEGKHRGDRNPPAGVPVWWGAKPSSNSGDVVISLGGGRVIATDQPRYGVIGECTIAERERLIGRPYLGWTESIFDAPIAIPSLAGTQEEDMPITEADAKLVAREVWNRPFKELNPGTDYGMPAEGAAMRLRRAADRAGRAMVLGRRNAAEIAGLSAAVAALADAQGLDPAQISKAITDAVEGALADVEITLTASDA